MAKRYGTRILFQVYEYDDSSDDKPRVQEDGTVKWDGKLFCNNDLAYPSMGYRSVCQVEKVQLAAMKTLNDMGFQMADQMEGVPQERSPSKTPVPTEDDWG